MRNNKIANFVFLVFSLFLFNCALGGDMFTPQSGDKSIEILGKIFGGLVNGGSADPFVAGIKVFNGAVLIIGGILVFYTVFSGTINTAHDGEMLGKKFSSVWIPIRYSVGTAVVLPVIGGGYCVMQAIVMWLVVQGIGLADQVWSSFMTVDSFKQMTKAQLTAPSLVKQGLDTFVQQSCVDIAENITSQGSDASDTLKLKNLKFGITKTDGLTTTMYQYGEKSGTYDPNICGETTFPKYTIPPMNGKSGLVNNMISAIEATQKMTAANAKAQVALENFIIAIQPYAAKQATSDTAIDMAPVLTEIHKFENNLRDIGSDYALSMDDGNVLLSSAKQDGWFSAGNFFNKIIQTMELAQRAQFKPESTGLKNFNVSSINDQFQAKMQVVQKAIDNSGLAYQFTWGIGNFEGGSNTNWSDIIKEKVLGKMDLGVMLKKLTTQVYSGYAWNDGEHPLLASQRMGGWIFGIATALAIGYGALLLVGGLHTGIATGLGSLMTITLPPMWFAGSLLKWVLPNVPYIVWNANVIGWLVLVVEACIAAPIWAVMHLTPTGHDLMGSGQQGYRLVLSLLLRPVLMIFGFVSAIVLIGFVGQIVDNTFADYFVSSQVDDNFFMMIVGNTIMLPILYFGIILKMCLEALKLIHVIPDQILRWLGNSAEMLGGMVSNMSGDQALAAGVAAGKMTGQAGDMLQKGIEGIKNDNFQGKSHGESMKNSIAKMAQQNSRMGMGSAANGGEGYDKQRFNQAFADAMRVVGGSDSKSGQKFEQDLSDLIKTDPSKSEYEHMNNLMEESLSQKFGYGSGHNIGIMSGGFSGPSFDKNVGMYKKFAGSMKKDGMSSGEIRQAIRSINENSASDFENSKHSVKNGGDLGLADFTKGHFEKFEAVRRDTLAKD
ncbi:DotA/TraY family protein [Burkholderia cenocepacia]|uniref:DotA/TraY family protein n=1 Tax=Burkholderia cenocepacia TaxID=95486 RepID=UPI002855FAA2|nr:DotA/TraY family protein [Burkholderia cenocepacia]MDR8076694.1 DotA/TraY family protein [Burkholderia cenocepacia]